MKQDKIRPHNKNTKEGTILLVNTQIEVITQEMTRKCHQSDSPMSIHNTTKRNSQKEMLTDIYLIIILLPILYLIQFKIRILQENYIRHKSKYQIGFIIE